MDKRKESYLRGQKDALRNEVQREYLSRGKSVMLNSVAIECEVEMRFQRLKRLVIGD